MVEQRIGGSTNIGMNYVAKAAPDGYTLLVVTDTLTSNASTFRDPGYDPVTSFAPITMLARARRSGSIRRATGPMRWHRKSSAPWRSGATSCGSRACR